MSASESGPGPRNATPSDRAMRAPAFALAALALVAGLLVQLVAITLAAQGGVAASANANLQHLLTCFALQAVAALLVSAGTVRLLPPRYRKPSIALFGYLWVLNFAVPVGGVICSLGALVVATALPYRPRHPPIQPVYEPEFSTDLMGTVKYGRGARLKAELQNPDLATSSRMTALLAMQSMPVRTTSPLLQSMLADPLDDIRLLAYGILDKREKELTQRILAERSKLDGRAQPAATGDARRWANKELAELYGELIYENLVTGDVYRHAAEQADAHARAALETDPGDASLWRLRGRLALNRRDLDAAEPLLQRAIDCGFPRERMLPYLAEAAYLRRDYARVRRLLAEVEQHGTLPTLQPVLHYWHLPHDPDTVSR